MAEKTKASSGVIAAVAILVLCILFPRSTWGYIFFIVGGIWIYRLLFASTSKPPASKELSQVKTGAAARTSNGSARATEQPVTAQMPNVS